ncbi:MAG TPA: alpha/beta hydrolase [Acidimicrobiales bacterium]|jgi:acetyl esterase/lipase|nr:alpha/beta hydrolase [Acidimicrobiales bacterium]
MGIGATVVFTLLALGAATAFMRVKGAPLSNLVFTIGFVAGELAGQLLGLTACLAIVLSVLGWPSGTLGAVALGVALAAVIGFGVLVIVGLRSRGVVARSLASARWPRDPRGPRRPAWFRWWRVCLAIPRSGAGVRVDRDVPYVEDGGDVGDAHLLDVIRPRGDVTNAPVMLYVHGGAWVFGSKREQGLPMLYELASRGWVCVSCNYRLSPKATWPDHVVDVKRAVAWTKVHARDFGGDPSRFLAISGGSAGGQLASLAALTPNDPAFQPGFEDADTAVDACVSLYGVLEMTGDRSLMGRQGTALASLLSSKVMKVAVDEAPELYAAASPIERITAAAPAFLVLQGTKDSLVPVEVARAFVAKFERASSAPLGYVELPLAEHAFDLLCSPRSSATTRGIATSLEALVRARTSAPSS